MAKLYATEMLARVTDEAIQIFGGMGLMDELPLERFWRDARVERIWDGTSEIQRHIISRDMLRPLGAEPRMSAGSRISAACSGRARSRCSAAGRRRGGDPQLRRDGVRRADLAGAPDQGRVAAGAAAFRAVAELRGARTPPSSPSTATPRSRSCASSRPRRGGAVVLRRGLRREPAGAAPSCRRRWSRPRATMPLLGPNCYGLINYLDGALLWFDQHGGGAGERGVAIVTQSGNIASTSPCSAAACRSPTC